jgi:hypothetical protein
MATRRAPTEIGGVERVVAGVVRELARVRPEWRVDVVSAFKAGSRIEGMDGFSDILAAFRLGWKLRGSTADVIFVHCPECLWGIRWLRKRQGARRSSPCGTGPARCRTCGCAARVTRSRGRWPGCARPGNGTP